MLKKRFVRILSFLLVIIVFICSTTGTVHAVANKIGDYILFGGVGSWGNYTRTFYITPSATQYASLIQSAMDSWIYTTERLGVSTSISWTRTYDQSYGYIDFYYGAYFAGGTLAATTFWEYSTQINPTEQNWGWGKIRLNAGSDTRYGFNHLSVYDKLGTIAHEIGHVFGLDETNNDTLSIMCQLDAGRAVNQPQVGDLIPIQEMYP